jgi:hypothetical protein
MPSEPKPEHGFDHRGEGSDNTESKRLVEALFQRHKDPLAERLRHWLHSTRNNTEGWGRP